MKTFATHTIPSLSLVLLMLILKALHDRKNLTVIISFLLSLRKEDDIIVALSAKKNWGGGVKKQINRKTNASFSGL